MKNTETFKKKKKRKEKKENSSPEPASQLQSNLVHIILG
jgi:hypothetical protein